MLPLVNQRAKPHLSHIVNHTIKLPIPRKQIEITPAIPASMQSSESSEEHNETLHFHGAEVSKLWYRTGAHGVR